MPSFDIGQKLDVVSGHSWPERLQKPAESQDPQPLSEYRSTRQYTKPSPLPALYPTKLAECWPDTPTWYSITEDRIVHKILCLQTFLQSNIEKIY
jgi:hypothetical protein